MDLKAYYQRIRETEGAIPDDDVVVVSYETPDGGVAGKSREVPKRVAARLLVEGRCRLATSEEAEAHRAHLRELAEAAEETEAASRIRVAVVRDSELRCRKPAGKEPRS
jgi:hypothetical protein